MSSYDTNNIFARIIRNEVPVPRVYEDDHLIAIRDIAPAAPVHVLVIPKGIYYSFDDFAAHASADSITHFFTTIRHIATTILGLDRDGYRLITNHGANASQTVPHFHVHILGGAPLGGLVGNDTLVR